MLTPDGEIASLVASGKWEAAVIAARRRLAADAADPEAHAVERAIAAGGIHHLYVQPLQIRVFF